MVGGFKANVNLERLHFPLSLLWNKLEKKPLGPLIVMSEYVLLTTLVRQYLLNVGQRNLCQIWIYHKLRWLNYLIFKKGKRQIWETIGKHISAWTLCHVSFVIQHILTFFPLNQPTLNITTPWMPSMHCGESVKGKALNTYSFLPIVVWAPMPLQFPCKHWVIL